MTLTLILIRHAKSSWDDMFSDDHARVLNARGRAAAPSIGAWMATRGYIPQVVLCSDAARTRETAGLILPHLSPQPELRVSSDLYHASPDTMLAEISKQTSPVLALIGHNPGIALLANGLLKRRPSHPRFADYPTCATTVITFDADSWRDAAPNTGTCKDFIMPGDLTG
ncbi:SixA phosphatase family protein [Yoonia sp.]|uniref:SixA phosphatase family protein n=1 Tax=Yoonia sp. TaxID=2212373 RepID=UPI003A4D223C